MICCIISVARFQLKSFKPEMKSTNHEADQKWGVNSKLDQACIIVLKLPVKHLTDKVKARRLHAQWLLESFHIILYVTFMTCLKWFCCANKVTGIERS